jgi:hypothetical protein
MAQQIKQKFLSPEIIDYFEVQIEATSDSVNTEKSRAESEEARIELKLDQEITDRQSSVSSVEQLAESIETNLAQELIDRAASDVVVLDSSKSYTDQKISDLVGAAPEILDTISEIATALQNEQSATIAIMNQISAVQDSVDLLDDQKEDKSNKSIDVLLGSSDDLYPSQKAVKSYTDSQDKKLAESTFSGVALSDFLPNTASIETETKHYSGGVALSSDKKYSSYFTDTQVVFVNAVNPYASKITHSFTVPTGGSNFPQAMTSIGNYIYMVTGGGRLYCFDWSDKTNPLNLGYVTIGTGQHFDVTTDGQNTLFIGNTTNKRVYIVDITNRATGTLTTSLVLGTGATDFGTGVSFSANYLYVSNYNNKIHVMSNASGSWAQVTTIPTITNPCRGTVVTNSSGHKLFFVQRYNGVDVAVYDLLDPALPVELKRMVAPAAVQIYNLPFIFDDIIHIGLDNGKIGAVNVFNKNDIKLGGVFEPKNADESKKFSSMRGLVLAETDSPFFKKRKFLLATGVINGAGSTQKVTTVLDFPIFDYIKSSAITVTPPAQDLSGIEADITAVEQALISETSRAQSAENNLQGQITSILTNTDPAALDSLSEIVTAFQSADSNLNNAISGLSTTAANNLANEALARENADDALQGQITTISGNISLVEESINALDGRIDTIESKGFSKGSAVVGEEVSFIDLDREYSVILSMSVGRLTVHELEDYTLSVVGGVTRASWIGSLLSPSGTEAIEQGDKVFWSGSY